MNKHFEAIDFAKLRRDCNAKNARIGVDKEDVPKISEPSKTLSETRLAKISPSGEKKLTTSLPLNQAKNGSKPALPQWPIKINLVPMEAPFFDQADLLIAADCAPAACHTFRTRLFPGKRIAIGCPKFGDARAYAQKLGEILKRNNIASITIAHMEVPCCSGLKWVVDKAVELSGKQIPIKRYVIKIGGEIINPQQ